MAGTIRLTFDTSSDLVESGAGLSITLDTGSGVVGLAEIWVPVRTSPKRVTLTDDLGDIAEAAILNYVAAWNIDHRNYAGKILDVQIDSANVNSGQITITTDDPVWTFNPPTGSLIADGIVTYEILTDSVLPANSVDATLAANDLDPCGKVDLDLVIEGDTGVYNIYTSEGNYLGVSSPYTVSFIRRAVHQRIDIRGENHPIGIVEIDLPRKISSSDISVGIQYGVSGGATITIECSYSNTNITPLEYSLNGVDYQSENVFTGIAAGSYTAFVRDAFGCVTEKDFLVDGDTTLTELVFNISEVNPIRFVPKREAGEKKNFNNSLACEDLKMMAREAMHPYPSTSLVYTQILTNAPYIRAYAVDSAGGETTIPHFKSVQNTGLTGFTSATMYAVNGKMTLYWGYTDTLDPDTGDVIGNTNFGAFLPAWANSDDKVLDIETVGILPISRIYYDSDKQSNVVELAASYSGAEQYVKVKGTYNEQPYDVYEFQVDMAALPSSFQVHVDYGVDEFTLQTGWISERLGLIQDSDEYIRIDYWDDDNRGNFIYQTGIRHHVYVKAAIDYVGEQTTEGYNGDDDFYKINDEVYMSQSLVVELIPAQIAHKLRLFTAHKYLYVNGLKCKLAEAPEIEGELATNLKTFTATLKASGNQFLPMDQQQVLSESDSLSGALEAIQGKANILWTKTNG